MAMRLEKREITLNEKDSITDLMIWEETLAEAYVCLLKKAERKETRQFLTDCIKEIAGDIFLLSDMLKD